ncbi:MAG: hypothetical protein ABI601_05650 [bacterium]
MVQLLVVLVPLSEGHEERVLDSHVEAPRSSPHVGHHPDVCPACILLGMHSRVEEPSDLGDLLIEVEQTQRSVARVFAYATRATSNSSRAPPLSA